MLSGYPSPFHSILMVVLLSLPRLHCPSSSSSTAPPPGSPSPAHRLAVRMLPAPRADGPAVLALPKMFRHCRRTSRESSKHEEVVPGGGLYWKVWKRFIGIHAIATRYQLNALRLGMVGGERPSKKHTAHSPYFLHRDFKSSLRYSHHSILPDQLNPHTRQLTCLRPIPLSSRAKGRTSFVSASKTGGPYHI